MVASVPLLAGTLLSVSGCSPSESAVDRDHGERRARNIRGTNWDGSEFALDALRGRPVVLAFGYTSCPDVCPMTMAKLKRVRDRIGDEGELAVVFVSVDPERDTVERLARYVPAFDKRFYGVRPDDVAAVIKDYTLTVTKQLPRSARDRDSYLVDHTNVYVLVDSDGRIRDRIDGRATPDAIVTALDPVLKATERRAVPQPLHIEEVVVRAVPGASVGAAYLKIVNETDAADRLLRASSPIAGEVQMHESSEEDGVARMRERASGFEVPARGVLELTPGGKHIMLLALDPSALEKEVVPLTLVFENAGEVQVSAAVKPYGG